MNAESLPILFRSLELSAFARESESALARAEAENWGPRGLCQIYPFLDVHRAPHWSHPVRAVDARVRVRNCCVCVCACARDSNKVSSPYADNCCCCCCWWWCCWCARVRSPIAILLLLPPPA